MFEIFAVRVCNSFYCEVFGAGCEEVNFSSLKWVMFVVNFEYGREFDLSRHRR